MDNQRTALGDLLYKIVTPAAIYVAKHPKLFYILSYTWGLLTTLGGWVLYVGPRIYFGKEAEKGKFYTANYLKFGINWGGLECGTNFLVSDGMGDDFTIHTLCHEYGHTCQNAVMGPFAFFLCFIPSVIRYWTRRSSKEKQKKAYDAFWAEGSASYIGEFIYSEQEKKDYFYYTKDFEKNPNFGKDLP